MKQKPIPLPTPHKPTRIILPPPEDLSLEELEEWRQEEDEAPEAYRQGNFLIMFAQDSESCIVADLNGKTVVYHLGRVEEAFALVSVLQSVRVQNDRIYEETFQELSDEEFMEEGLAALDEVMAAGSPPEPDIEDIQGLLDTLRGSFLDELIKPPKKKKD